MKERHKSSQSKLNEFFSPISTKIELIKFATEQTGLSRCNLTNKLWHDINEDAAKQLFGFNSFEETILCVKAFFTDVDVTNFPKLSLLNKKIKIRPSHLTEIEQTLMAKMFVNFLPQRNKLGLALNITRQCVSWNIENGCPIGRHMDPMFHC